MSIATELRQHANDTAGDGPSGPNYDPVTLDIAHRAADHIDKLERENAKLREALKRIARRVPIMGSEGDYRSGQLHALEACSEVARIALKT